MPTIRFLTSDRVVSFDDDDVNLLRFALRNECGIPFKCASGNCGTDRVKVESGADHCSPVKKRERETLGDDLVAAGWRLACQTYVSGDVAVSWDPGQTALTGRAGAALKQRWLAAKDGD